MVTLEGRTEAVRKIEEEEVDKRRVGKRTGDEYESFEYLLVEKSREQKVGKKRAGTISGKGALTDEGYDKMKGNFTHNNNDSDDDEISAKVKAALGDDDSGEGSRSGKSGDAKQLRSFLPTKFKKSSGPNGEDEEIGAAWSFAGKTLASSRRLSPTAFRSTRCARARRVRSRWVLRRTCKRT